MQKVALVTGSNKGIGFETVRQLLKKGFTVILTSRDEQRGLEAVNKLKEEGLSPDFHQLEVINHASIEKAFLYVEKKYGRLDVLVNNAGIFLKDQGKNVFEYDINIIREVMETNFYGALQVTQKFYPLLKKSDYGRIINLSSGMGQLSDMEGGSTSYRVSKTSLNALTKIMAYEVAETNILVNSVCPGWVKTDMGGSEAPRSLEKGAETVVWLAEADNKTSSGRFFRDKKEIAW